MKKIISKWLLKCLGWSINVTESLPAKFIICMAPHTSNWDFFYGQLYSGIVDMKINFLMKKEWFFWPLGPIFRHLGGIPVYRSKKMSMTDSIAATAIKQSEFRLCITPEGTRQRNAEWKHGFYYIALKAQLPILLFAIDYERKLIECTRTFVPTGDVEKDMAEIKQHYKDYIGKKPENFTI